MSRINHWSGMVPRTEWEGHVTLEISNTRPLLARIFANEGLAQVIFFRQSETCGVFTPTDGASIKVNRASCIHSIETERNSPSN